MNAADVLPADSSPATTTAEQNMASAGRRFINVMWERTQQYIAIMSAFFVLLGCNVIIIFGPDSLRAAAFTLLSNIGILVIGTYFQRTNHSKTGGVGSEPRRGE